MGIPEYREKLIFRQPQIIFVSCLSSSQFSSIVYTSSSFLLIVHPQSLSFFVFPSCFHHVSIPHPFLLYHTLSPAPRSLKLRQVPFQATSVVQLVMKVCSAEPPALPPHLSSPLRSIVLGLLQCRGFERRVSKRLVQDMRCRLL